jgi:uncharacterized protein YbbC (DUF1343 family)
MNNFKYKLLVLFLCILSFSSIAASLLTGAAQTHLYLPLIKGKSVGMVVNQTASIGNKHLVDSLLSLGIHIKKVFAPEHGFRGDHSAGEVVQSGTDPLTGLQVISLYGKNKKPSAADLASIDYLIFDIQDVGARFYTYISTLHYVMEACAENNIPLLVLDRPNPNGFYIDGPILDTAFHSFVGMHPVPIVHGCTMGEYAQMINGEKWLKKKIKCALKVIQMKGYTHLTKYELPIRPSPNLPNQAAIYLYPSLCLFEGTSLSLGRGTDFPFECVGKPKSTIGSFVFVPKSIKGVAEHPPFENQACKGFLLRQNGNEIAPRLKKIQLQWLIEFYNADSSKATFFTPFFNQLAGTNQLRKQIEMGMSEKQIRQSWSKGIAKYKVIRRKYLLYKDFE